MMSTTGSNPFIHYLEHSVQIFDTDCYGVMWHGAYTKWLEMGRIGLLTQLGITLPKPNQGLVFPVIDQHFRFRTAARFGDTIVIESTVILQGHRFLFNQPIRNLTSGDIVVEATTTVVLVDQHWRLIRRIPSDLASKITRHDV